MDKEAGAPRSLPSPAAEATALRVGPIPWAKPHFWQREEQYVSEALASSWISGGPFVERFEDALAEELGASHAVVVSNGSTAIHLSYLALGIGAGDEVIVPGFGFLAAANIAYHVGATPVFAEVDRETWCIDAADVARRISPRTRAIVAVHTYGNVADMNALQAVANQAEIPIVEDAAEAFASRFDGRSAGTIGRLGTLSFQATKTITTGEGGAVLTSDADLFERMCLFRSHGMRGAKRYWHHVHGHNFRLTNLQAAIGLAQIESLDRIVQERRRIHERYTARLAGAAGLRLQLFTDEVQPVLWAMAARLEPEAFPQGRDKVMRQLAQSLIETRPGFYSAGQMDIYATGDLPACDEVSASVVSLPTYAMMSDEEIAFVCDKLMELRS